MDFTVTEIKDSRTFRTGPFMIQVVPSRCQVLVSCWDWNDLNGGNAWWHHGCETIWHFIAQMKTDPHYAMKKLFGDHDLMECDEVATRKGLMALLEQSSLDHTDREEVTGYLQQACDSQDFGDTPHLDTPYEYIVLQEKPCCLVFRDMWPVFCDYIKDTIIPSLPKEPPNA